MAGQIWFEDLGTGALIDKAEIQIRAKLLGKDSSFSKRSSAAHTSHKGTFGDVAVLGGESTPLSHMEGAALLAARAALHAGAGRVFVALLGKPTVTVDLQQPELMFRSLEALDLKQQILVCGCGGGQAIKLLMPQVLSKSTRLVLDADALNAIANDPQLQTQLIARHLLGYHTVLTPHPLEAARLLNISVAEVQGSRLTAAEALAERFQCVLVLKGSGTVIASSGDLTRINSSGNALLATAGTGDVLAGIVGAYLARGTSAFEAACAAVMAHGDFADRWAHRSVMGNLTASALATAIEN